MQKRTKRDKFYQKNNLFYDCIEKVNKINNSHNVNIKTKLKKINDNYKIIKLIEKDICKIKLTENII